MERFPRVICMLSSLIKYVDRSNNYTVEVCSYISYPVFGVSPKVLCMKKNYNQVLALTRLIDDKQNCELRLSAG